MIFSTHWMRRSDFFRIPMQEANISRTSKPFGVDMLKNQPQKVFAFHLFCLKRFGFAIKIAKRNIDTITREDIFFTDDASIEVAG